MGQPQQVVCRLRHRSSGVWARTQFTILRFNCDRFRRYRYYNKSDNTLDIGGFIEDVLSMPHGSLIVMLFIFSAHHFNVHVLYRTSFRPLDFIQDPEITK